MRPLRHIYTLGFLFSWGVALTAYVNSSLIEKHLGSSWVGIVFALGSCASLALLETMPFIVKKVGNESAFLFSLLLSLLGMTLILEGHDKTTMIGFIIYTAATTAVFFSIDIFLRHLMQAKTTGTLRGLYLGITNLAWMLSPLVAGRIVERGGFGPLYLLGFIMLSLVAILSLFALRHFRDAPYYKLSLIRSIMRAFRREDMRDIFYAQFLLQLFYAIMVVFAPLYLIDTIGFHFSSLGIIFTIMLFPFVLLQFPLGMLADRRFGEKEMLALGFLIMALATMLFASYKGDSLWIFAWILFATRVGAATVEIMSETYFFKKVAAREPELVSTFRSMTPLAYIVGVFLAGILLPAIGFPLLFALLAIILLYGIRLAYAIHDTK